jgi:CBS domain-containing protein
MIENVVTVKGNITAESAIRILHYKHIGSVIVVDDEGRCEGIFTERDAIQMIAQKISLNKLIQDVMTKNPFTIHEDASFGEAISIISSHGIRHLPVVDKNKQLVGLLSIRKFLDEVMGITC